MTQEEKIAILEENLIEYEVGADGSIRGLCKMTTFAGDDCSEWLEADELIEGIRESEKYFKR